ncbi:MAG TPA: squalene--hopene cyclase, partial [Gammaproteobacteria bacterium]|nr:squalene--hopene cyclase [Gammaproteobacteria bacterium]
FSPVWDTSLALLALQEESLGQITTTHYEACQWLKSRQLTNEKGDWQVNRPTLLGGGFAFQYENSYYPDLDDTAVVAIALFQGNDHNLYDDVISRAANWLAGMQSQGGGFASFDVDNTHYYLNEIPFADHGALLDPPTADVSARCAMLFGVLQQNSYHPNLISCIDYLLKSQEKNGSWFGRWGTNYIYGTWSVLVALEKVGFPANHPAIRKAVQWLKSIQNPDGGFGESNASYFHSGGEVVPHPSTSFQTAWAILGLLAAGEEHSNTVQRGVQYLVDTQKKNGFWHEPYFTAPGFPRVFYLKYHGYSKYFPLWALARFRNKIQR